MRLTETVKSSLALLTRRDRRLLGLAAVAPRADHLPVVRREEEVVQHVLQRRAARIELAGDRHALPKSIVVHETRIDRRGLVVVGNLPRLIIARGVRGARLLDDSSTWPEGVVVP